MSTENNLEPILLDEIALGPALTARLDRLEEEHQPVAYLEASLESWEKVKISLLGLRASNVPGIVLLKPVPQVSLEEIAQIFIYLKNWDQLYVHNFLALCSPLVPEKAMKDLQLECKIELKWVKEWLMASHDSRISKYPSLPWRSFIRKIVQENFEFAQAFLRYASPDSEEKDEAATLALLSSYLKSKKKAVCIFPKNWGKLQ